MSFFCLILRFCRGAERRGAEQRAEARRAGRGDKNKDVKSPRSQNDARLKTTRFEAKKIQKLCPDVFKERTLGDKHNRCVPYKNRSNSSGAPWIKTASAIVEEAKKKKKKKVDHF